MNLKNKNIFITGGTGPFGQAFVGKVLRQNPEIERLVVFSRDELKQHEMSQKFNSNEYRGRLALRRLCKKMALSLI